VALYIIYIVILSSDQLPSEYSFFLDTEKSMTMKTLGVRDLPGA